MCCNYLKHNFTTLRCLHTKKSGFNVRRRETVLSATLRQAKTPYLLVHTSRNTEQRKLSLRTANKAQSYLISFYLSLLGQSLHSLCSFLFGNYLVYTKHNLNRTIARYLKTVEVFTTSTERGWNSISNNSRPRVVLDLGRAMMERERRLGGQRERDRRSSHLCSSDTCAHLLLLLQTPRLALSPDVACVCPNCYKCQLTCS